MIVILKWIATVTLIAGSYINSARIGDEASLGPWILVVGGLLWLVVSIAWRERALIVTNTCMVLAGAIPLISKWFT